MDREQIAKVAVTTGLFALAILAVFAFWFVLPSMQGGDEAYAQGAPGGGAMAPPGGPGSPPAGGMAPPGGPGSPPGGGMGGPSMGGGMGGGMMGGAPGGGGAAPAGGAPAGGGSFSGAPLEPSRANPFASIDSAAASTQTYQTRKTRYGPDWSRVPLGYLTSLPQPSVPPAPPAVIPPNPVSAASLVRVNAVVWPAQDTGAGSQGRAFAAWEGPDGVTRVATPGSQISVTDPATRRSQRWRVTGLKADSVQLRNVESGEETTLRVQGRSRAESRYSGARRLSGALTDTDERNASEPGAGATVLSGGGGGGAAGGMMGGAGMNGPGGGMGGPGGGPGMMGPGGRP